MMPHMVAEEPRLREGSGSSGAAPTPTSPSVVLAEEIAPDTPYPSAMAWIR